MEANADPNANGEYDWVAHIESSLAAYESDPGLDQFEWDDAKNEKNYEKWGIHFESSPIIFAGCKLGPIRDNKKDYGETRWQIIGDFCGLTVSVSYTERTNKIRIISIRKATQNEERRFREVC